jgi:hypothetical protein
MLPFWSRRLGYGTRIGPFLTASLIGVSAAFGERKREDDADPEAAMYGRTFWGMEPTTFALALMG